MSEVSRPLRQCSLDTGTLMVDGEDRRVVLLRRLPNNHALAAVDIFNIEASRESRLGVANGRQRDSVSGCRVAFMKRRMFAFCG